MSSADHESRISAIEALLPPLSGTNPSSSGAGSTPGSFARGSGVGGPTPFSSQDGPGMPPPSDKTAWDFGATAGAPGTTRETALTQLELARLGVVSSEMTRVAQREGHLSPEEVRDEIAAGRLIIPANRVHLEYGLDPIGIGRAARTKVNANIGTSPISSSHHEELCKLEWAVKWGADAAMDLSTGGDVDACREAIIKAAKAPIGTVPMYAMIRERRVEDLTYDTILAELEKQAIQGVDFFTIHAGILRSHLHHVRSRLIGIVSRGGSLIAKWMTHHGKENPFFDMFDDICALMRQYDVSFSLGDGLRPGGLADATDKAQLLELATLGELTERAWSHGCQVMVEGPGHVPFDHVEPNMKLQRRLCHGAPFYVLGPIVTDMFPGYDHITSAIGATAAAFHGASMLCYVTPKEHLGLPKREDVKQGCIAYKIAAHAADIALGIPRSRDPDDAITKARADLDWNRHFELSFDQETARSMHSEDMPTHESYCSMCGHDWCAVRINKEIRSQSCAQEAGSKS